jgi:ABC-type phosphate transport system auxiliary subunit
MPYGCAFTIFPGEMAVFRRNKDGNAYGRELQINKDGSTNITNHSGSKIQSAMEKSMSQKILAA